MATLLHEEGPPATYSIAGFQYSAGSPGFVKAIAHAHAAQRRPRCMCTQGGVETYVAKLNDGYVVKRMPETGSQHAATCSHFDPEHEGSGLNSMFGTAIRVNPVTGLTTLKLDFSMSASARKAAHAQSAATQPTSACNDQRLTLRQLLLYLWDQAGLNRWQPGFAGKRSWAMVSRRLLRAAGDKIVGSRALVDRLFVPEPFTVDGCDALRRRRAALWSTASPNLSRTGQLLLMIGELKEVAPARLGYRAVVKQVPDVAFILREPLYRQMIRRLQDELELWNSVDDLRMILIATFAPGSAGVPTIMQLALMPTTREWIPIESLFELELVSRLTAQERGFLKYSSWGPQHRGERPCVTLTDRGASSPQLGLANFEETWPEAHSPDPTRLNS